MKKRIFNKRLVYSLIALGILLFFVTGIYAGNYINQVTRAGHDFSELQTCGANQILKMNSAGTAWNCGSDNP